MKVWQIQSFGIDQLVLEHLPQPRPGRGEVLMKVHAVSLNYRDLMIVRGHYNPKMPLPRIPCSDGAGEVIEVGEDVKAVTVGQRVAGIFMQNWLDGPPNAERSRGALGGDVDGMLAEYVVLPQSGVVSIPEYLSYAEAATLPCAGLTAWNGLTNAARVKPGDVVVTQGTGGVSVFALQFAKRMGATVIGTSSSDEKLERARTLGLDAGLNYRQTPDWARWVLQQTNHRGADLIVEVGGAGTFSPVTASSTHRRHGSSDRRTEPIGPAAADCGAPPSPDPGPWRLCRLTSSFRGHEPGNLGQSSAAGGGSKSLPSPRLGRLSPPWKRVLISGKS